MIQRLTPGIDISQWQNKIDTPQYFNPLMAISQNVRWISIRASQSTWADRDFLQNWAICRPYLYRMPYHFLVWDISAKRQAEFFWGLVQGDLYAALPLICDFEWWTTVPSKAMDWLYGFLERLKQLSAPKPLGIYTAKSFWDQYGSTDPYWLQYPLWLCDIQGDVPIPKPWQRWTFWQYTFKLDGLAHGVESLDLDGDYYNGSLADMMAEFQLPVLPYFQTQDDPRLKYKIYLPNVTKGQPA